MNRYYLIRVAFLGFRYHGWQKQPKLKTVQLMVEKTIAFVVGHQQFKTLGASRTDAMVSANDFAFELFIKEELSVENFQYEFQRNLPSDIEVRSVEEVSEKFNIINHVSTKEYLYYFSFGIKHHPFCAPFMAFRLGELDVELMSEGARLFEGEHNFRRFCYEPREGQHLIRRVKLSCIEKNDSYQGCFFPENSFVYRICSSGFLRHQVRIMMGVLFFLGEKKIALSDIEKALENPNGEGFDYIAPSSGLVLNRITFWTEDK